MQERQLMREPGIEAEFIIPTVEELQAQAKISRRAHIESVKGNILVKGKEIPWNLLPQGVLRSFNPVVGYYANAASDNMAPFQHLIPHHSGRHRHQGGYSLFVVDGKGHTVVDGVSHPWEEGDLVLLPIKVDGCEHQHFNDDPSGKPSRWMATPPRYCLESVQVGVNQRESSPLWTKYRGAYKGVWTDDAKEKEQAARKAQAAAARPPSFDGTVSNRLDELFKIRDQQREWVRTARMVVRFKDVPWEINRLGKMKWYLHPNITDTAHRALIFYIQEIPPGSRSGKMQQQGGFFTYIWRGKKGYSIINDKRYDWEQDDMLFYPVNGDTPQFFQHFNSDPENPTWLVVGIPNLYGPLGVDMGVGFEVLEDCPEWRALHAGRS